MPTDEERTDPAPLHPRGRLRRRARATRWAALGVAALAVAAAVVLGPSPTAAWDELRASLSAWQGWAGRNPVPAVAGFFLAGTLATAMPLPGLMVTSLFAGALFGTAVGGAVVSLAYTAGVTISFLAVRRLFRERVRRGAGPWLGRVERGVERDGAYYLLTLRLMPSVPFFLVNVLMALTPIRTRTYAAVSWAGSLPAAFLCAGVGTGLASLKSPSDALSLPALGARAVLATAPTLGRVLVRRARIPRTPTSHGA